MTLSLRTAAATDVGLARTNNEDSFLAGRRIIAVADGIGGMPAGELASKIVTRSLARLDARIEIAPTIGDPVEALAGAVDAANNEIATSAAADQAQEGMGTTVTAMLLFGNEMALVHVGDSRAYLLRDSALSQLTKDHTFVQALIDEGMLTAAEARVHPRRSVVTQALQGLEYSASTARFATAVRDRFLVCTDGLSDALLDEEIEHVLRYSEDPLQCANRLVQLALAAGASDNVTVVVADVVGARGGNGRSVPTT